MVWIWSFLTLTLALGASHGALLEREMTVEIPAGKEECFYQTVQAGQTLDVDYQVVDGGSNNELDISFRIARPNGVPMVADFRKLDNTHRTTVQETGDYRICFDNVHHSFSSKTVYFEVIIESGNDEEDDFDPSIYGGNVFKDAEEYDMKVEDIEHKLRIIKEKISQSRHFQDQIRAHELRDRSVAEHNFERINFWSFLHVFALLSASLIQVLVVKSLFDEKSKLRTLWNKIF